MFSHCSSAPHEHGFLEHDCDANTWDLNHKRLPFSFSIELYLIPAEVCAVTSLKE